MIYVGLDDTDNLTSRGTGQLARGIAAALAGRFTIRGVTRHQLLVDPRVPYTSHNSSAAIHIADHGPPDLEALADRVQALMLADFQDGSDPGLCVARDVPAELCNFGRRAKTEFVSQAEAREAARRNGCILRGLGGTQDGVIGALAAVGLAATGNDGRFLLIGSSRELAGMQTVQAILQSGVAAVRTVDGRQLVDGMVDTAGRLRPALRGNQGVLYVTSDEKNPHVWRPLKLD